MPLQPNSTQFQVIPASDVPIPGAGAGDIYVVPPGTSASNTSTPLTITVPYVFQQSPTSPLPNSGDFALTSLTSAGAVVTVAQNQNLWKGDATSRQNLYTNWQKFCAAVDFMEVSDKTLVPGGAASIVQQVAGSLPLTIGETLLYQYSFNVSATAQALPSVVLQPGMRLRVEYAAKQYVGPASPFNGYVGGGQCSYDIVRALDSQGMMSVGFDAFWSAIADPSIQPVTSGQAQVVASMIDLQTPTMTRRYYGLFYPTSMVPGTSDGNLSLANNVALIGADSIVDLTTAAGSYASGQCATATVGRPIVCAIFRGRMVAVPEIAVGVALNASPPGSDVRLVHVPLGTTVRQLVDRLACWNGVAAFPALYRPWTNSFLQYTVPYRYPVQFPTQAAAPTSRVFDLPLLKGDILSINYQSPPTPKS